MTGASQGWTILRTLSQNSQHPLEGADQLPPVFPTFFIHIAAAGFLFDLSGSFPTNTYLLHTGMLHTTYFSCWKERNVNLPPHVLIASSLTPQTATNIYPSPTCQAIFGPFFWMFPLPNCSHCVLVSTSLWGVCGFLSSWVTSPASPQCCVILTWWGSIYKTTCSCTWWGLTFETLGWSSHVHFLGCGEHKWDRAYSCSLFMTGHVHFPAKGTHNFCFYFCSGNSMLFGFMLFYEQEITGVPSRNM